MLFVRQMSVRQFHLITAGGIFMWDVIKVVIGLLLMTVIGLIIFAGSFLLSPINSAEVAEGLPAVPKIVFVGLVIILIMDLCEKKE